MTPNPSLTPESLVPRLGDYLIERKLITTDQLSRALEYQAEMRNAGQNILLGQILIDLGYVNRSRLDEAITEQIMQLRNALQDQNRQLEIRVQERTAELQVAYQKLSELSQLKSNIIANISHELRTPLTHIKGYVELMAAGALGPLTDEQTSAFDVVQKSTNRLERLVEDLIHFSIASRGEFTLNLTSVNLKTILEAVINRSLPKAQEKGIQLAAEYPPDLPLVKADSEKISWVLLELVDNGIKFTPSGGRVAISAVLKTGFLTISVCDTGIGISNEKINDIFEAFHQLDGSATRRYGGTGLGLALVKQIVEAHGASIQVHSQPGTGSIFDINLALA